MKPETKLENASRPSSDPQSRGAAAAKAMTESLTAEQKRWNMPLLGWKNGKITRTQP